MGVPGNALHFPSLSHPTCSGEKPVPLGASLWVLGLSTTSISEDMTSTRR